MTDRDDHRRYERRGTFSEEVEESHPRLLIGDNGKDMYIWLTPGDLARTAELAGTWTVSVDLDQYGAVLGVQLSATE